MNRFILAHGYLPGPTQRPVLTGALTGALASVPSLLFAWWSGALDSVSAGTGLPPGATTGAIAALATLAGALYGRIFMRAANDRRGGWLFGLGFGFLFWMLAPGAVPELIGHGPLATGRAAQALFAAHLLYGLLLGLAFPYVHASVQARSPWTNQSRA